MNMQIIAVPLLAAVLLAGCASRPTGPSVMVLPAPGKSFDQFNLEDARCRQWAAQQVGISPQEKANRAMARSSAVGTAVGAGVGAVLGAVTGHPGTGAALGAGGGLLVGSASGSEAAESSGNQAQRQFDIAYQQCMYSYGNQIPGVLPANLTPAPPPPPPR
ncbi:YMGG-like glycine zipper-containing protein [Geomesophilobacter sediminis]|uniref:Glycine zipper family protein n=1 Tax=Geomesophilobacter sediminis TaxID=2798584 RepID=A0A8J7JMH7_9BACT|nr:YMGG-like glycine zipper-containing protein [Geomesophilobacter sediminis]MBJ6725985.1 glycine zipper family protein [Geomesophilobacter sediminis]